MVIETGYWNVNKLIFFLATFLIITKANQLIAEVNISATSFHSAVLTRPPNDLLKVFPYMAWFLLLTRIIFRSQIHNDYTLIKIWSHSLQVCLTNMWSLNSENMCFSKPEKAYWTLNEHWKTYVFKSYIIWSMLYKKCCGFHT